MFHESQPLMTLRISFLERALSRSPRSLARCSEACFARGVHNTRITACVVKPSRGCFVTLKKGGGYGLVNISQNRQRGR